MSETVPESMKPFFTELAELMKRHSVDMTVTENIEGYYTTIEGIEFDQMVEPWKSFNVGSYCDAECLASLCLEKGK